MSAAVRYVTVAELVARLGVTRQTLARWCAEGTFCAPFYFGRAKRFLLADVERWEAEHRQPVSTPPPVVGAPAATVSAAPGACAR